MEVANFHQGYFNGHLHVADMHGQVRRTAASESFLEDIGEVSDMVLDIGVRESSEKRSIVGFKWGYFTV